MPWNLHGLLGYLKISVHHRAPNLELTHGGIGETLLKSIVRKKKITHKHILTFQEENKDEHLVERARERKFVR